LVQYTLIREFDEFAISVLLRWAITSLRTHQFFGTLKIFCDIATLRHCNIATSQPQLHLILICTANMPAHEINLNPFKDHIISWFNDDMSYEEITKRLANDHNIVCTDCTIRRRLRI
jgi:hypothetical protein